MSDQEIIKNKETKEMEKFKADTELIGKQTEKFLELVYPAYLVDSNSIERLLENKNSSLLDVMTYFHISCCKTDNVDKIFETVNAKIEKLFTAFHSIGVSVGYGLISRNGTTNLVLSVYSSGDVKSVKNITRGMLSGIEMEEIVPNFAKDKQTDRYHGILSGIPSLYLKDQKQTFSLSSIMQSLNGIDYTLLFIAKPISTEIVTKNISDLISIKDECFAVSKRNVARANSYSETTADGYTVSDTKASTAAQKGAVIGGGIGAGVGAAFGTFVLPGPGTIAGVKVGGMVGGGLGTLIGTIAGGVKVTQRATAIPFQKL